MKHVFTVQIDDSEAVEILAELKSEAEACKCVIAEDSQTLCIVKSIIAGLKENLSEIN